MNGKRKFKSKVFIGTADCSNESFRAAEEELEAGAKRGSAERGSRILQSSIDFSYDVLREGVLVRMTWTEIFGEKA